ncbi:CybS-domain-containing protein [Tuber magnatum]|uniref:Succinate dehydrogenase [ubiquinone] cytochrome b small subunit n=1 Tax=Tuber magnatum TaxID=42249 RepID=A0A317SUS9_9PEZI|nr:CybS-domain-containing protein [Tuber magnatum]
MASLFRSSLRTSTATAIVPRLSRPVTTTTTTSVAAAAVKCTGMKNLGILRQAGMAKKGFHVSASRRILPAGPQIIQGTVNDAAEVPDPNATHGSYHWSFERLISVALIPLTVAPFAAGSVNPVTDAILGATIVIHSHIGFESMVIDYIPHRRYPTLRKGAMWALKGATVLVLVGLYEFETNDVGITEAIKRVWRA